MTLLDSIFRKFGFRVIESNKLKELIAFIETKTTPEEFRQWKKQQRTA